MPLKKEYEAKVAEEERLEKIADQKDREVEKARTKAPEPIKKPISQKVSPINNPIISPSPKQIQTV